LRTIAQETRRQLREMADAKGVDIRVSDDLPEAVVDVAALELVLVNLVSNAIKYSDPDKIERYVEIGLGTDAESRLTIDVRDNGVGIAPGHLDAIFNPHFRAHVAEDARLGAKGLGLGLTIVKDCLRALGGSVSVDSREGEGTVFRVSLPMLSPDSTKAIGAEAPTL
jgi:two-component system OmpR family sensor kinase